MDFENKAPKWDAEGTEPSADLQTNGFKAGYKPPAPYFNYLFNKIVKCINELQTKLKNTYTKLTTVEETHRLNSYISLEDIGLSMGKETIEAIATGMPYNSQLLVTIGADNAAIYPQTYGILHVIKKDNSRVVFKFYSKTTTYEYLGIYDANTTAKWSGWDYSIGESDVVDNLTSTDTKLPLSAKQGKVLDEKQKEHAENQENPHKVTKEQVGLGNVPNVATNDQTPTYSDTTTLATLKSGEKLNVALQKIKCAITNLINHINSHKLTTLTSLGDVGQTFGSETISGIAEGMPSNSELLITVGADNAAIYPQTYGVLHVLKKDSSRVVFKFYSKSTAYEYLGIYDASTTTIWSGWVYSLRKTDVVNNLSSTATDMPLSAKQGNALNTRVSTLEANKINGGAIDFSSSTLADIVEFVGSQTGRAFVGRFKLAADHSPTGINTWFRGVLSSQNVANDANDVSVNIIALSGDNITYTGNIYGLTTFTLRWSKLLRGGDVVDNLLSTATNLPLSANQGKVMWNILDALNTNLSYCKVITSLPAAKEKSFFFSCNENVVCGNIIIPKYSKGIYIDADNKDAVVIAVDSNMIPYYGYRNGSTWSGSDTTWQNVNDAQCQYRAKNGVCVVQGQSWGNVTLKKGEITHIGTIPYPYCPTARHKFSGASTAGNYALHGYVEPDGKVYLCCPGSDLSAWMYSTTFII